MAEHDEGQERTEQATPKRREEARRKGDIPRSRDFNTMVLMVASSAGLMALAKPVSEGLGDLMRRFFTIDRATLATTENIPRQFADALFQMVEGLGLFFLLTLVVALVAPILLGGWVFSAESMMPQFGRMSPLQGLQRMFGLKGILEMFKALLKFAVVAGGAIWLLWRQWPELLSLGTAGVWPSLASASSITGQAFFYLCLTLIAVAALDAPFQLWDYSRRHKMSRQEIKDEMKESDGRPEVKSRIRRLQQEMANRRMMQEVPKADVIITNPTHYAVALRYDPQRMSAPRVIAKGADEVARKIREAGEKHRIILVSAPPLARALYHSTKLNQEIPAGLYLAVAQVLAYVFKLRSRADNEAPPNPPKDFPIPEEFRHDA
jgi:flagellar biosynthetic protein FlhB